jgi:hypothetical protein
MLGSLQQEINFNVPIWFFKAALIFRVEANIKSLHIFGLVLANLLELVENATDV